MEIHVEWQECPRSLSSLHRLINHLLEMSVARAKKREEGEGEGVGEGGGCVIDTYVLPQLMRHCAHCAVCVHCTRLWPRAK